MKNNTFMEIISYLTPARTILILTHVIADGDTIGSAKALSSYLRGFGKRVDVYPGEKLPEIITFLEDESFIADEAGLLEHYDVVCAIDCSDRGRFENRAELFERGDITVNIDHHGTNDYYADLNYVDANAAAVGEIIFTMIKENGGEITSECAEGLYAAIVTDTGQFQYSNTTPKTHKIAAELLETGIDLNYISVQIYQNVRKEKYALEAEILKTMEFRYDGKLAFAYCNLDMLDKTSAEIQDSDGIVELLRNINTVSVACFAKEVSKDVFKVGFRSKHDKDVSAISAEFGGGGHKKAAGCTINGSIEDVKAAVYKATDLLDWK